ncbi:MAG TPA: DUF4159 domain-containing protein, partial [Bryobacteraceae bacterium]
MRFSPQRGFLTLAVLILAAGALAQRGFRYTGRDIEEEGPRPNFPSSAEFHFIRLEYNDLPEFRRGFGFSSRNARGQGWWMVDWPDADDHFSMGIGRLTRVATGDPRHFGLTDDRLFDYPWIYATQTAWWDLSDAEIARLREYLLRGGFLVTDDFWGEDWGLFASAMARLFPSKTITDIPESDAVMHVVYDIREKDRTWIPGTRHLWRGPGGQIIVRQPPGTTPAWRAMYDDRERVMVAINYNTDVGDAWEYADAPFYPENMTTLAYHYGVNYVVYSMTH